MPTILTFHTQYWEFSDSNAAPLPVPSKGGYPMWQAAVITPSLFGIVGAWIDARMALLRWHWSLARRVHRLSGESRAVLMRTVGTLESPAYAKAQAAVRTTATTIGFTTDAVGKSLKGYLTSSPGRAENTMRHLHAMRRLQETAGSTLTNHEQNWLTELAYVGFTLSGR